MTEKKVTISLKGEGLSYESEIDEVTAGQVMAICLSFKDGGETKKVPSEVSQANLSFGTHKESAAEYMNRHAPKRNPDKILVLAGFLKDCHKRDFFQQGEIKSLFRDAGEMMPANFTRDFRWSVSSGWIAPDTQKKGNFYITRTGRQVLEGGFPEELVKKSKNKAGGRRKKGRVEDSN